MQITKYNIFYFIVHNSQRTILFDSLNALLEVVERNGVCLAETDYQDQYIQYGLPIYTFLNGVIPSIEEIKLEIPEEFI